MSATLRKHERVQRGSDFRRARAQGQRIAGRLMLLNVLRSEDLSGRRLGLVTSRQLGGAVVRNRARRILREAWRLLKEQLVDRCDVVIVARRGIVGCSMQQAQHELINLLKSAGAIKSSNP